MPVLGEYETSRGENADPLGEDTHSPVPGLVHRYPDRVLLLVTNFCSVYCRYCTRARMVGSVGERSVKKTDIELALDYIDGNKAIRDVLISGGDPLSLDDDRLEYILKRLRKMRHVEFIRIGSKQPVVQPMRITPALTRILKRYHPLWMSLHFTHPDELTPEVAEACARLADAGIPLGSQTVLLKGVNDDVETMKTLVHGLLRNRVKPYYLYQCDPISGSAHFRTPVSKGVEIIRGLRGHTTGYAVPTFVVDAPRRRWQDPGRAGLHARLRRRRPAIAELRRRYLPISGLRPFAGRCAGRAIMSNTSFRVGLTYDLRDAYLEAGYSEIETAEFDRADTIDSIESALRGLGYEVDRIGNIRQLTGRLVAGDTWDLVFNICEGMHGIGREAQVPALLDAYEIPYVFSDTLVCALSRCTRA